MFQAHAPRPPSPAPESELVSSISAPCTLHLCSVHAPPRRAELFYWERAPLAGVGGGWGEPGGFRTAFDKSLLLGTQRRPPPPAPTAPTAPEEAWEYGNDSLASVLRAHANRRLPPSLHHPEHHIFTPPPPPHQIFVV